MRAILFTLAGIALVVAIACAIPLPSYASSVPAPPASAPAQHAPPVESNTFTLPHGAALPPNSDVITPYDCGKLFCTLPAGGLANVFRVFKDRDDQIAALELEVARLKDVAASLGPRRCATLEPLPK